jgi:hypothetical protein
MVREVELYPPVEALFKDDYIIGKEIELGAKRIDLVCVSKQTGKIVTIELKVKNWKKALRQAWSYRACANESYIAIPEERVGLLDARSLLALGLGVIGVPNTGPAKIIVRIPSKELRQDRLSIIYGIFHKTGHSMKHLAMCMMVLSLMLTFLLIINLRFLPFV